MKPESPDNPQNPTQPDEQQARMRVLAHASDYLDDSLADEQRERIDQDLKAHPPLKDELGLLQKYRGRMQLALQEYILDEAKIMTLRGKIRSEAVEAKEVEDTEKFSQYAQVIKTVRFVLIGLMFITPPYLFYSWTRPDVSQSFDAVGYLGYEALAIEKDPDRLGFQPEDREELLQIFGQDKSMGFDPHVPASLTGAGAEMIGASVIDYDEVKVATVVANIQGERVTYFTYLGALGEFTQLSAPGQLPGGQAYYAFSSEELNLVIWQPKDTEVGVLASRVGADALAEWIK